MRDSRAIWILVLFISVCLAAAGAGAIATGSSVRDWYPQLRKPSWNPPSWVFGPVWTALYLTMAIAAWLVWRKLGFDRGVVPLGLFAFQLALNALWSPLFFGLRSPAAGLVDIVPLWAAILATLVSFWRVSPPAGALLVPYWTWVSFAAALNVTIWRMNR